jgi:hypothetical protein
MNLLQLAQAVKRESGLTGGGPAGFASASGDDLRIFHWAIWAWRDIDLMHEAWSWRRGAATATTTTNTLSPTAVVPGFALTDFASWLMPNTEYQPSGYRVSDGVANEQKLIYLPYDEWRRRFVIGTQTAAAVQYWSIAPNGDFLTGPAPDTSHFIRADYIKDHVALAADGDIPTMPTRFHPLIAWYALREYGGFDAASEVWQRADRNYKSGFSGLSQACLPKMRWGNRPL